MDTDADPLAIRNLARSLAKNFSLYGERCGVSIMPDPPLHQLVCDVASLCKTDR